MSNKTWIESMLHPSGFMKWLYKSPILLYRLGLGFIVGHIFMVMTTIGRKSGQARRTPIEFHEFKGRKYVFSGWGTRTDWYRNIEAHPHITIQTWRGAESVTAHRLAADTELAEAFEFAMSNPTLRAVFKTLGFDMNLEEFLAQKDRFTFVTFEPTNQSTPAPLKADLWWVWLVFVPLCLLLAWIVNGW